MKEYERITVYIEKEQRARINKLPRNTNLSERLRPKINEVLDEIEAESKG